MSEKKYSLYVGTLQDIDKNIEFSFFGEHGLFVYHFEQPKGQFYFVNEEMQKKMSEEERTWLLQSKIKVNSRYVKENKENFLQTANDLIESFEKELKLEVEKMKIQQKQD